MPALTHISHAVDDLRIAVLKSAALLLTAAMHGRAGLRDDRDCAVGIVLRDRRRGDLAAYVLIPGGVAILRADILVIALQRGRGLLALRLSLDLRPCRQKPLIILRVEMLRHAGKVSPGLLRRGAHRLPARFVHRAARALLILPRDPRPQPNVLPVAVGKLELLLLALPFHLRVTLLHLDLAVLLLLALDKGVLIALLERFAGIALRHAETPLWRHIRTP